MRETTAGRMALGRVMVSRSSPSTRKRTWTMFSRGSMCTSEARDLMAYSRMMLTVLAIGASSEMSLALTSALHFFVGTTVFDGFSNLRGNIAFILVDGRHDVARCRDVNFYVLADLLVDEVGGLEVLRVGHGELREWTRFCQTIPLGICARCVRGFW